MMKLPIMNPNSQDDAKIGPQRPYFSFLHYNLLIIKNPATMRI